jgi:hypothetical protein
MVLALRKYHAASPFQKRVLMKFGNNTNLFRKNESEPRVFNIKAHGTNS